MRYRSTRGGEAVPLEAAVLQGLAPDGGLYVPESLPSFSTEEFDQKEDIVDIAGRFLSPFFAGSRLASALDAICVDAFSFPIRLKPLPGAAGRLSVLELFHGPTAAFKDVGARFLAACMQRLQSPDDEDPRPARALHRPQRDRGAVPAAHEVGRGHHDVAGGEHRRAVVPLDE